MCGTDIGHFEKREANANEIVTRISKYLSHVLRTPNERAARA